MALITGRKSAILMDTGYGLSDNRSFIESLIDVPYIVINSHGHPDHTQGNFQFENIYMNPLDIPAYQTANTRARREQTFDRFLRSERLCPEDRQTYADRTLPDIIPLTDEPEFDLGGIRVKVVELPGHTKGEVGLLIEKERLLLSGDSFNPDMWMFADNHDTLDTLEQTLQKALSLPFDTYIGSHTISEIPQAFLKSVLENVRRRNVNFDRKDTIIGRTVYPICYDGPDGYSEIFISKEDALHIAKGKPKGMHTLLTHGGGTSEAPYSQGSMLPPIYQTSAFAHESAEEIADIFGGKQFGFNYSRLGNPTVSAFEQRMSALEHGFASLACASGMAAITYSLLNLLEAGDTFIASRELYGGTFNLFDGFEKYRITPVYVDALDMHAIESAVTDRTRLIFVETLSNPGLNVYDIRSIADIAHKHGIPLIVDNTMTTPYLTRPLDLGADIVINSTSKYINGSGTAVSGVVTDSGRFSWDKGVYGERMAKFARFGKGAYLAKLRAEFLANHGACLAPQHAFLNMVGMETLGLRMERECTNALALAEFMDGLKGVEVNYPGLLSSRTYAVAKKQLGGYFGAVLTLRLSSRERAFQFMNTLKIPYIVSNIGDTRTLVIHPASTMALHNTPEERMEAGVYDDLVRVSVGIEDLSDLLADFHEAYLSL